jgi:hypothetical protein
MTPTGFEPDATTPKGNSSLGNPPPAGAAISGAVSADFSDPGLARIIATWPSLPETIRRAVLALVESASPFRQTP